MKWRRLKQTVSSININPEQQFVQSLPIGDHVS